MCTRKHTKPRQCHMEYRPSLLIIPTRRDARHGIVTRDLALLQYPIPCDPIPRGYVVEYQYRVSDETRYCIAQISPDFRVSQQMFKLRDTKSQNVTIPQQKIVLFLLNLNVTYRTWKCRNVVLNSARLNDEQVKTLYVLGFDGWYFICMHRIFKNLVPLD